MEIRPTNGGCGAEVAGADLNTLSNAEVEAILDAHAEYGVVFFRDQRLTPDAQLAAAERFGPINVNRFFSRVPEQPRVAEVLKEAHHPNNIGGGWHTDHSYDQLPAMGSMLYAIDVPAHGGDTMFANMYKAYESLSDGLKRTLEGLSAVHSSRHVFGPGGYHEQRRDARYENAEQATQDAVHPVVIRHPRSGRPALYVNGAFTLHIEGWTVEESQPLLQYLYRVGARPEHTCRFRWEPGSVAFWDNRATWHYALDDYPGETRRMHRVTIDGGELEAYAA
ncbi:MAG: TauD/TfdA family dioxygenase [Gammaproteobacteria bacterium]|nr:TauD/TfdA family dioxygenase [Gammaproteobacteria bacterium]